MLRKTTLLTLEGPYAVFEVESLGNQAAVVDAHTVFVADTGHAGINQGVALAALGAALDLGYLAWPALNYDVDPDET
jgi:hypothetical protein